MIDEKFIASLRKLYATTYLQGVIMDLPFEVIRLKGGKNKPESTRDLYQGIEAFQRHEKRDGRKGWQIEWEEWSSRKLGKQQWPSDIIVSTEEDFLFLIHKEDEVKLFKAQLQLMLAWNDNVRAWLYDKPLRVFAVHQQWQGIRAVVDYVLQHNVSNHFLRSLPVPVHTKFIEENESVILSLLTHLIPEKVSLPAKDFVKAFQLKCKPEFYTIRWLDQGLADVYTHGMEVLKITPEGLRKVHWLVKSICVVENETNLYLLPSMPDMLAIEARGKALTLLQEISLLRQSNLFYWGDLDEDGFHMLSHFARFYPHVKSIMMDEAAVRFHYSEIRTQPTPYKMRAVTLKPEEQAAYEMLAMVNGRIEQEKLQQAYIQMALNEVLSNC